MHTIHRKDLTQYALTHRRSPKCFSPSSSSSYTQTSPYDCRNISICKEIKARSIHLSTAAYMYILQCTYSPIHAPAPLSITCRVDNNFQQMLSDFFTPTTPDKVAVPKVMKGLFWQTGITSRDEEVESKEAGRLAAHLEPARLVFGVTEVGR